MSYTMNLFLVLGGFATLLFIAGYVRGTKAAIATYDDDRIEVDTSGDIDVYWWKISAGVIAATVIIFLVGVNPIFVYVGPFLAIVTAAANGMAFFVESRQP